MLLEIYMSNTNKGRHDDRRGYRPKIQQTRTNRKTKPLAYSMGHSKNTYYKYRIYHRQVRLNGPDTTTIL